jgi:magnesium transporter
MGTVAGVAMSWHAGGSGNGQSVLLGLVILLAMTAACMASGLSGVLVPLMLQ